VHKELPEQYGRSRDWNVDLIPKFLMASGKFLYINSSVCFSTLSLPFQNVQSFCDHITVQEKLKLLGAKSSEYDG